MRELRHLMLQEIPLLPLEWDLQLDQLLMSLALFGAFVSRAGVKVVDVLSPKVFIGLTGGAMLPYWFSAMTMKSVIGSAALKIVDEVLRQFNSIPGLMEGTAKPDYATCVKFSTNAFIKEMIPPGALLMLTLLTVGTLFCVETLWCSCWCSHLWSAPEGDPLKDTSNPSLNILIKLMAVESLVFMPFFATHRDLLLKLF